MKSTLLLLITLSTTNAIADSCPESFSIDYKVTNGQIEKQMRYFREGPLVAYESDKSAVADIWFLTKHNKLKLTRVFEQHQQGLEYEPMNQSQRFNWLKLSTRVDPKLLENKTPIRQYGKGCETVNVYKIEQHNGQEMTIGWLTELNMMAFIESGDHSNWQATNINLDQNAIQQTFKNWQNYRMTDYVDIGDNESDPFLAKMINQGFVAHGASGMYRASGELIEAQHSH